MLLIPTLGLFERISRGFIDFPKRKKSKPDGWTVEFLIIFFDLFGKDLLRVAQEFKTKGTVLPNFNSTFIALIPKVDKATDFGDFKSISLCNCVYKIIAKILAVRLNKLFSIVIYPNKFGSLERRQIHDAVGAGAFQEGLHSIKTKKLIAMVENIDLSKAYDHVCWLYLRMLLIHIGFSINMLN
jgi:hypothetical protein